LRVVALVRQPGNLFPSVRFAVDIQQEAVYPPVGNPQEAIFVKESTSEIMQGTLDLMVLKTLEGLGPLHGYGIARRIEQVSEGVLSLNQGTIYPALLRLQQKGWIKAEWGSSENNRRAKYYSITRAGRKQLANETEDWERISAIIARMLDSV
jgi:PadR family transcriptional regulator PadR